MIDIPDPILPEHFDRTHIDILGRGPSVDSYVPREGAFVICCHYPMVRCNAIVSTRIGEWGFYPIPYIGERYAQQTEAIKVRDWGIIRRKPNTPEMTTGQLGYIWACAQQPKSIHLWGFDSLLGENSNNDHSERQNEIAIELYKADKMYEPEHVYTSVPVTFQVFNNFKKSIRPHTTIHKGD
jgi:hypothetical protein